MLFHTGSAMGIIGPDRAIVRTLRLWIATSREARRVVVFGAPEEVLLLKAEPETVIVIVDRCPAIRLVWGAVGIEYLGHHEVGILATRVGIDGHWLEQAVGVTTGGLLGAAAIK